MNIKNKKSKYTQMYSTHSVRQRRRAYVLLVWNAISETQNGKLTEMRQFNVCN